MFTKTFSLLKQFSPRLYPCVWVTFGVSGLFLSGLSAAASGLPANTPPLDWQSKAPTSTQYCAGYYLPYEDAKLNPDFPADDQPLYSNSDTSEYSQGITHLNGNVEISQGTQTITGDYARFDTNQEQVDIIGGVKFRRPNLVIESDDARFNIADSEAQLGNAQLAIPENELRASSTTVNYHSDDTITMNDGSFTFCPPGNNSWAIHSNQIDLDTNKGFGEATHAVLKLGAVPVFYLPWMSFPIDDQRRSGFLFPTLVRSSQMGLDVTTPYYVNIATNIDAVVTPRFTEKRGITLGTKLRHMNANSEQELYVNVALNDPDSTLNRWLLEYNHKGQLSPSLTSSIKIKRVSDGDVFDDYGYKRSDSEKNSLISTAQLNYTGTNPWTKKASLAVITHQNLTSSTPAFDKLPHATLSGGSDDGLYTYLGQPLTAAYTLDLTHFTRNTKDLAANNQLTGTRIHLQPSLATSWVTDYSFVKPKLSLPTTRYQLANTPANISSTATRIVPQLEIDSGLLFERELTGGYVQTLEPRLYYAFAPYQQQDDIAIFDTSLNSKPFYQANRFTGLDRIGDTNRVTLALESQFLDAAGWQKAKLSVTQLHYLGDRKVQLNSTTAPSTETFSPIYGHMSYQFTPDWSSSLNVDFSPKSGDILSTSATMKYQVGGNKIVDIKYTEALNSTQQGEVSVIWPIAPQWTLVAKHKEDLRNQQLQDEILGVEYANCCWKGRLVSRHWLVDQAKGMEHGVFFELSLKGLGNSDKQLTSGNQVRMADFMKGITGYNEYTE